MNKILETTKYVVTMSEHVTINRERIAAFCKQFQRDNIRHWLTAAPFDFSPLSDKEKLHFLLVSNSISFCYWSYPDKPKWTVEYRGKKYDGSWGMIIALRRAIENKTPVLDPHYLADIQRFALE